MSTLPYVSRSATSRAAAETAQAAARSLAFLIWRFAAEQGEDGIIADEAIVRFSAKSPTSITARMRALKFSGLLIRHPDEETRQTRKDCRAEVWVANETVNFNARYREPPPKAGRKVTEDEYALLEAAKVYTSATAMDDEDRLMALFEACFKAYPATKGPKKR